MKNTCNFKQLFFRNKIMEDDQGSGPAYEADAFPSAAPRGGMTVEHCQGYIQKSFTNPMVKFLKENLEKSGCSIGSNFIKAVNCEENCAGGYARGLGIVVCSNHLEVQDEVEQTVIHELIHAYDECRAGNLDWANCAHHACSEIRAAHLSGDCHYKRELLRGFMKIRGHEPRPLICMILNQVGFITLLVALAVIFNLKFVSTASIVKG